MHLIKNLFLVLFIAGLTINGKNFGQSADSIQLNSSPELIGTVYSNFHSELGEQNNAFNITRAYLGFQTQIASQYSVKIVLDIGSPDDLSAYSRIKRYAYFKNASLNYNTGKVTLRFGLISTYLFKVQEKFWQRRYLYKMLADEHHLGSSADLGASVEYSINKKLNADLSFMNGEGYSHLQLDNAFKTGFGLTYFPFKFLILRGFYDFVAKDQISQGTLALFAGFQIKNFNFGSEFNYRINHSHQPNNNITGYSFYTKYHLAKKWEAFGRYDILTSNSLQGMDYGWNYSNDGSAIIAGIEFQPIRKVRLALNYQDWVPYPPNLESRYFIFLNLEFKI